jgi:hypothetical protein
LTDVLVGEDVRSEKQKCRLWIYHVLILCTHIYFIFSYTPHTHTHATNFYWEWSICVVIFHPHPDTWVCEQRLCRKRAFPADFSRWG